MDRYGLEFRPVLSFEDKYLVSNNGLVFSIHRNKMLKTYHHPSGYDVVTLYKDRFRESRFLASVHRLVAQAFILNPENKPQINHKDCDRRNNHFSNLEWCTNLENQRHAIANGRVKHVKGNNHANSKITEDIATNIRIDYLTGNYTYKTLGLKYGILKSHIGQVLRRVTWKHVP